MPQQALVLLNDPTYVEAARVFAERIVREGGPDAGARLRYAYARALQRAPSADEARVLADAPARSTGAQYARRPRGGAAARRERPGRPARDLDAVELAAWTSVARAILNLPEVLTRS